MKVEVVGDNIRVGKSWAHNVDDPVGYAEEWVQGLRYAPHSLIVQFGIGLGHELRALTKRLSPHDKIIVVEPHDEVVQACQAYPPNIVLNQGPWRIKHVHNWLEFKLSFLRVGDWIHVIPCALPAYTTSKDLAPQESYEEFTQKLERELNNLMADCATTDYFAEKWQSNVIRNMPYLGESGVLARTVNQWRGKSAVLVSAGPSLNKNIHLLEEVKGKALILAGQTTNRLFEKAEIKPDLIFSFDGDTYNFDEHFDGVKLDVPLVYDPTIYYRCLRKWHGKMVSMLVHPANKWMSDIVGEELGGFNSGPSIACTMFDVAWMMGCNPIILIGQDLAYTDNRFHAAGTHVSEEWDSGIPPERSLVTVKDSDAKDIITDRNMLTYLHWFEEMVKLYYPNDPRVGGNNLLPMGERTIVNCTEGGANIVGIPNMPFKQAIEQYIAANDSVEKLVNTATTPLNTTALMDFMWETNKELKKLHKDLIGVMADTEVMLHRWGKLSRKKKEQLTDKMIALDEKIAGKKKYLHPIHYALRKQLTTLERPIDIRNEEKHVANACKQHYNGLRWAIEVAVGPLEELEDKREEERKEERSKQ